MSEGSPTSSSYKPNEVVPSESRGVKADLHVSKDEDEVILSSPRLEGRTWLEEALVQAFRPLWKRLLQASSRSMLSP